MPPLLLTNFEIQKYYQNEPIFNGVYSRDILPNKIKNETYVINLNEYSNIGTNRIALYSLNNNVTYFGRFGVEYNPKRIKIFIDKSTVITNFFRTEAYDSVMCEYFCVAFIAFMLEGKTLRDFTKIHFFHQIISKKNDDNILNYFLRLIFKNK